MAENDKQTADNQEELGVLTDEEKKILDTFRRAMDTVIRDLGRLDIQHARLVGAFGDMEGKVQNQLVEIGKRLGIQPGIAWHVTPEGKVRPGSGA